MDSLFGPASPPSFLDAEHLVSPTSKNIWGSPLQEVQQPPQHVNNIQSLFDFAKSANSVSNDEGYILPKTGSLNKFVNRPGVLVCCSPL